MDEGSSAPEEIIERALNQLKAALALLDSIDVSADIGAHIDLGIHRLEEQLQVAVGCGSFEKIRVRAV